MAGVLARVSASGRVAGLAGEDSAVAGRLLGDSLIGCIAMDASGDVKPISADIC